MDFIRKNAKYLFGVNAFETFEVNCFVLSVAYAFFFYKIGVLPAAIVGVIGCLFYVVCFCFREGNEQTVFILFYLEIGLFSMILTTFFAADCGFCLYLTPLPFASYMEIKDRSKSRKVFVVSMIIMVLEIPLSILGELFFTDYRLAIEPYRQWLLLINFAIVIISNLFLISYMAERDKAISETQFKSEHDVLTGLYNRTFFSRYIKNLATHGPVKGAIIMFDIDNFKKINDQYGHDVGDVALKMVTRVARNMVRSDDVAVRWGGEEFIIFLQGMELQKAAEKAEEIRAAIEATPYSDDHHLTVTFGVTVATGDETFDSALKRADDNLYTGKTTGKNKVVAE